MVSIYKHPPADLIEEGDHMVRHLGQVRAWNLVAPFREKLPTSRIRLYLSIYSFLLSIFSAPSQYSQIRDSQRQTSMNSKCTKLHIAWTACIVEGRVGPVGHYILRGTLPCNTIGLYRSKSPHPGLSILWCTSDESMTH